MKYAILVNTNGSNIVKEEGITDISNAKARWHYWCNVYESAKDVKTATVMLADENLDAVEGKKEYIFHKEEPTTEE